jgi:putative acyl-CoA dehydrogenase
LTVTMVTHEVVNQPPALQDYDLYGADPALVEAVKREGAAWASVLLQSVGELAGSPDVIARGTDANRYPPELVTHDRFGHRIDQVRYHPAYHQLMDTATGFGLHCLPWDEDVPGAHVARAAAFYLWSQVDAGHGCPISMTYSAVPAIRQTPALAREWEPRLTRSAYDPSDRPACSKTAALAGMGMTEKQGGSDVRANTTRAEVLSRTEDTWKLTGHKWFFSAPMGDVFLMLAQTSGGLSCFLVPRWLDDGERNVGLRLQRLKDKLGNRSNASSEVELDAAVGRMVGEEGRGVPAIIEMVNHTRLDCVLGAAATMRQATVQAVSTSSPSSPPAENRIVYSVRSGDTLGRIAGQHGVTVNNLRQWNNIRGSRILVGQRLTIYTSSPPPAPSTPQMYTVQRGDTLITIARRHSVTVTQLRNWNNLRSDRINAGQRLRVSG